MEFGGNTTCVFISGVDEGAGSIIMVNGMVIRKLGKEIAAGIVKIMSYKIKVFILFI